MHKNGNDVWLALLILKSTPISGIDSSPAELLCNRKLCSSLPLIKHTSSYSDQAKLRGPDSNLYQTRSKALVPLSLGSCVLYDKNPDNTTKRPELSKGTVIDLEGPCKYTISSDNSKNVSRTK